MVKNILIKNFDYNLPDENIARFPLKQRDACRLILSSPNGDISHHLFSSLPDLLPKGALLICNETKVINARMDFYKSTGSRIEIFLLEPSLPADYAISFAATSSCRWSCMVGNLKRWKQDSLTKDLNIPGVETPVTLTATRLGELPGNAREIEFSWNNPNISFAQIVESAGNIPIPPYLNRESRESDNEDYQTVFSRVRGSVAAPTAGLHFTDSLLSRLKESGIQRMSVVLHVGAGTFQPVKSENIGDHPMHTETFTVTRTLITALIDALKTGQPIVAVGTTSVRTLESLPILGTILSRGKNPHVGQWDSYIPEFLNTDTTEGLSAIIKFMDDNHIDEITASTAIMIAPGFKWRIVNGMVTNFHQPQSTLLLLVSSFLQPGMESPLPDHWKKIYDEALSQNYRFLSYGDACILFPIDNE